MIQHVPTGPGHPKCYARRARAEEIGQRALAGESMKAIAYDFGIPHCTVQRVLTQDLGMKLVLLTKQEQEQIALARNAAKGQEIQVTYNA